MDGKHIFSREELAALRAEARKGSPLECPRCRRSLMRNPVPSQPGVGYVRRRSWWICPGCRRSAVLDAPGAGTGDPEGRDDPG